MKTSHPSPVRYPTRNFVAPDPQPARRIEVLPPEAQELAQLPAAPVELRSVATSEVDRAIGFTLSTSGLAVIVGVGGVLLAVAGWGVPVLSVTALAIFFVFAALVWAGAWMLHVLSSEGGIGLMSVLLQYRLLRHEQKERHRRIERMMEDR